MDRIFDALFGNVTVEFPPNSTSVQVPVPLLQSLNVKDKDLATPPANPLHLDAYIVGGSPTGAWADFTTAITVWAEGVSTHPAGWYFFQVPLGTQCWVVDEAKVYVWNGTAWVLV